MISTAWDNLTSDIRPLTKHPEVRTAFHRAAARVESAGMSSLLPFLAKLGETYAKWTDDLPGSERYHHARPYGLVIHAAETVEWAFAIRGTLMDSFAPVWHQVLLTLALLHDCGRLFDIEIEDSHHGDYWDPTLMSLHLFRETRWLREGHPVRWRSGRGFASHEDRFFDLAPILVGGKEGMEFISALSQAWSKYLDRRWQRDRMLDFHPYAVAQVVAAADQHSVREDLRRQKAAPHPPPRLADAPVGCYSSSGLSRRPFLQRWSR